MAFSGARRRQSHESTIKLIVLGESTVGKTCLIRRFCFSSWSPTFVTTIGIDVQKKAVVIDDEQFVLQIWDTAGQERFRSITLNYIRGAQGVLLTYDLTNRSSFEAVGLWAAHLKEASPSSFPGRTAKAAGAGGATEPSAQACPAAAATAKEEPISVILVGNKCDCDTGGEQPRAVSTEEGRALAEELGAAFIETSAREDTRVEEAFTTLAELVKRNNLDHRTRPRQKSRIYLGLDAGSKSVVDGCCPTS
uniref:Uncharacterized protein n=1 Tax=Rhizochromulina marina TaxID=1034831 RepID=A0A7S2WLC9_9STRA|mmetsp:Transcript_27036/g.78721  ORF Transcript_27036/g.78721 Transcript_27036/m.78721 type:complete len:250 (+) Transcript_27036:142-891(+)